MINWTEILGWNEEQLKELRFAAFSLLRQGQYEKARLFFQALLILNPESHYDAQMLGALYLQMGQAQEALIHLDYALNMDPTHEPTHLNKIKALLMLGQKTEALVSAGHLSKSKDRLIANDAKALILSYS